MIMVIRMMAAIVKMIMMMLLLMMMTVLLLVMMMKCNVCIMTLYIVPLVYIPQKSAGISDGDKIFYAGDGDDGDGNDII